MSRIPLLSPEQLTPDQAAKYATAKLNIYRLVGHDTVFYPLMSQIADAMFSKLHIPPVEREIMVLAVLQIERGKYEWAQHEQIALHLGIGPEKIAAIKDHAFGAPVFTDRERALLAFARQVVSSVRVDDAIFNAVAGFYDSRQIIESIFTIGIYMTGLRITEVAELEVDDVRGASIVQESNARIQA